MSAIEVSRKATFQNAGLAILFGLLLNEQKPSPERAALRRIVTMSFRHALKLGSTEDLLDHLNTPAFKAAKSTTPVALNRELRAVITQFVDGWKKETDKDGVAILKGFDIERLDDLIDAMDAPNAALTPS